MSIKEFLGLTHHKHSGKQLPHKHTSYAGLAIITLFAGLVPALMIQSAASADPQPVSDTIAVTANIDTEAPTITSPVNDQRFTGAQVIVSGTCQEGLIVGVFKNDLVAGSTPCLADGTFSLQIELLFGKNDLYARHFRPGAVSPASNHVIVYFDQVVPGTSPTAQHRELSKPDDTPALALEKQLVIISEESVKAQLQGKSLSWKIRLEGGLAPYALSWDWGDGTTSDLISLDKAGEYTGNHTYASAGNYQIKIKAADSNGQTAELELVAIATGLNMINRLERNLIEKTDSQWLWWTLTGSFTLFVSFWLGEHFQAWRNSSHRRTTRRAA